MTESIHNTFIERFGVPKGWDAKRLCELAGFAGGGTPDSTVSAYWDGDIPWLTPTEMTEIEGRFAYTSERQITEAGMASARCSRLEPGTLVMSTRGTVGSVVIAGVPLTCNQSCEALLPVDGVDSDYLYFLLSYWRPLIERYGAGTTFKSITRRDIRHVCFSVPDRDEQKRISQVLAGVEEALSAVRGQLAAARRLKTALMQQLFTKGIPGRHRKFKTVTLGRHEYTMPDEWQVKRIQDVLIEPPFNGVSPQSRPDPPGTPILNVACISEGQCDPSAVTYVDIDDETLNKCEARQGDFYVLRGNGNREYVGAGGWLRTPLVERCIFSDKLIRLRFDQEQVADGFTQFMWQSHSFLRRLQSKAESGSGLWMMSKRSIRHEYFLCPQKDEQQEIVNAVNAVNHSIATLQDKAAALLRLKKSLLQNLLTGKVRVTTGGGA